jgi:hypothetical protein
MSNPAIEKIARMDLRGTLEVEHLLGAARNASPALAEALDELATARSWPLAPCFPDVPMGTWARVVSIYCRESYAGLLSTASETDMLAFVIGLLEDLRTEQALTTLLQIATTYRKRFLANPEQAGQVASALNIAAIPAPKIQIRESERMDGRDFLHEVFLHATVDHHRVTIMCALRFFGDETSLPLISSCPPLPVHWESARTAAVRAIRKRAKQRASL